MIQALDEAKHSLSQEMFNMQNMTYKTTADVTLKRKESQYIDKQVNEIKVSYMTNFKIVYN